MTDDVYYTVFICSRSKVEEIEHIQPYLQSVGNNPVGIWYCLLKILLNVGWISTARL